MGRLSQWHPGQRGNRMTAWLRKHWLFCLFLAGGVVLRVLVQVGFKPTLFFFDSFHYLQESVRARPDTPQPMGYPVLVLRPLLTLHDLAAIPLVQHLCGLGVGVLIYAVLLRRGARPWVGAVGAAPVLLDAYQLQIEQMIASDAVFITMVAAAVGLLLWRPQPTAPMLVAAGTLLGLAATVRFVGGPLIAVACLYVLFTSYGRRRILNVVALAATAAIPLLVYSAWTMHYTGEFRPGGASMSARTLYARAAPLANCEAMAADVPAYEMQLCPNVPRAQRHGSPMLYMAETKPENLRLSGLPQGVRRYDVVRDFAMWVFVHQPVDVGIEILEDFGKVFAPVRYQPPDSWDIDTWRFPAVVHGMGGKQYHEGRFIDRFGGPPQTVDPGIATVMRGYQDVVYTWGPVFALAIIVAAWAGLRARRLRAQTLLVAGTGLALLGSAAVYAFSWRYQLPAITFLPWALALGATALWPWARQPDAAAGDATPEEIAPEQIAPEQIAPEQIAAEDAAPEHSAGKDAAPEHSAVEDATPTDADLADDLAMADFSLKYGDVDLAPVVVVMAAYNEADSIQGVLDELPALVLGLAVDVVVVDDGSTDGTGKIADKAGALVARLDSNRGQGAALRIGYRVAREGGASYIVTTDADGQYDAREMPDLLLPLVEGDMDFVSGSRRLGTAETTDRVRGIGVRVFAALMRVLTGAPITDPANGFRAMRAEVTQVVTLSQPQYQASELLIATLAQGFRVTERPTTMRERAAGETKKGGNLLYGFRFARVVLGTWRRERKLRRAGGTQIIAERGNAAAAR